MLPFQPRRQIVIDAIRSQSAKAAIPLQCGLQYTLAAYGSRVSLGVAPEERRCDAFRGFPQLEVKQP